MDKLKTVLVSTNSQRVLDFFLDYPGKEFMEKDLQRATKISKSGINYALRELSTTGFLFRNERGKIYFYTLNYKNPVIKQLKVLKVIIQLMPVIKKLEKLSSKVVLFGSSARGEDVIDSDIDLFVISNLKKEEIEKQIYRLRFKRKIQLVVYTELGHTELKRKDPVFYAQVQQGIVLWEKE